MGRGTRDGGREVWWVAMALLGVTPFIAFTTPKGAKVVREWTVRVKNDAQTLRATIVTATVPANFTATSVRVQSADGQTYPAQLISEEGQRKVLWLEPELPANAERIYRLQLTDEPMRPAITLTPEAKWVTVQVDGQPFTRYYFADVPKPFCFPIVGPNGKVLTRGFPVEPREGESRDHPHHKGFWVAYGDVNGVDFWSERHPIVHRTFEAIESGSVMGRLQARNEWQTRDGKTICEEIRELRFYALPKLRMMDLTLTFIATEGEVTFGDTKEGFVAIRLPDELTLTRGTGHILNATGHRDREAWGKRASWCLYYGTLNGEPVAVAFFDHPKNRSYPTPWHVRDYGLFANGPFGRKDFGLPAEEPVRLGKGERLTLRYRLVFLAHHPTAKEVDELWAGFARPPRGVASP
jgi:hypothetical protein